MKGSVLPTALPAASPSIIRTTDLVVTRGVGLTAGLRGELAAAADAGSRSCSGLDRAAEPLYGRATQRFLALVSAVTCEMAATSRWTLHTCLSVAGETSWKCLGVG